MKEQNSILFGDNKYRQKIYSVTYLRFISYEIYKFIFLFISIFISSKLSHFFLFRIFFEINFDYFSLIKIFIYLLILDISYFIFFKSNTGIKSFLEFIVNCILHPEVIKLVLMSLSFCLIFFYIREIKSLMPRLDVDYIRKNYSYDNNDYDYEDSEIYEIYDNSDFYYVIITSIILFLYMIFDIEKFEIWPKLNLSRINYLKINLFDIFANIIIIGLPSFIIIYIFLIFFYRTLFIFHISLNYTNLFVLLYNISYINLNFIKNFICAPINYTTNEINTPDKLIKKEINFSKEENFYICHHLQNLRELYEYPKDIKYNTNLLLYENLKNLQKKVNYFIDSINKKYSLTYYKRNYSYINQNSDFVDKIKNCVESIKNFFDYSINQTLGKETCVQNIKILIDILANATIFISDAKTNKLKEDKYNECKDFSYYFVDKLIDLDTFFVNLIQNKRTSESLKKYLHKLRAIIKNYFELIRYKQMKNKFLKLVSQKLQTVVSGKNIY